MEAGRSQGRPLIEVDKWHDVVKRFLEALDKADTSAPREIASSFGQGPTIVMVGPTGSGKTALLNSMIGFSLLPEGTDHTTPVPTLIRHGQESHVKALGGDGKEISHLPHLKVDETILAPDLPSDANSLLTRLYRDDDFNTISARWYEFWSPVFEAAKAGDCACIEATIPAAWLPECVRLVDVPGYEGWFPEDSPELHNLVMTWMGEADCAIHVMEKTKIFLGGGLEFIRRRRDEGYPDAMFVSQMDTFNSSQVPGHEPNGAEAWNRFEKHVRERLTEEGIAGVENMSVFFGAGRLRYSSIEPEWMENNLLSEMDRFFSTFRNHIARARARCAERRRAWLESAEDRFQTYVVQEKKKLDEALGRCVDQTRRKFVDSTHVRELKRAARESIDAVDFSLLELFKTDKLAKRFQRDIESKLLRELKGFFEESLKYYMDLVRNELEKSLENLIGELRRQRLDLDLQVLSAGLGGTLNKSSVDLRGSIGAFLAGGVMGTIGAMFLMETTKYLLFFTATRLNPVMAILFAIGAIIAATAGSRIFSLKDRLRSKLKGKIDAHIDETFLAEIWKESTRDLARETSMVLWDGRHSDGRPVRLLSGEHYVGLEVILRTALEEHLLREARCWRTCGDGTRAESVDI
ncbi:MAG: dynamin family protein [Desulfomonilaceae bacterium]|nr:dynamin family protein [Desulfomonilaceae bacterium]